MERCTMFVALLALAVNVTVSSNMTATSPSITSHSTRPVTTLNKSRTSVTTPKNVGNTQQQHSSTCKTSDYLLGGLRERVILIAGGVSLLVLLVCCMVLACWVCCLQHHLQNFETASKGKAQQDSKTKHRDDQAEAEDVRPETAILLEGVKSNESKEGAVQGELGTEPAAEHEPREDPAPQDEPATMLDVEGDAGKGDTQHSAQNCSPGPSENSAMENSQNVLDVPLMV